MTTWHNAPPLTNVQRAQLREGLLVEYAPGRVTAADLAAAPALRGALLAPLLPPSYTAVTLTALWIHTGWWPEGKMRQLHAAHPARTKPPATYRRSIPPQFTITVGGTRLTTPARTVVDLLLMETSDVAMDGIFHLVGAHLTMSELFDQLAREEGRRRLGFARSMIEALAEYLTWRTHELRLSAAPSDCPPSSTP